jgi:hypothetical protein
MVGNNAVDKFEKIAFKNENYDANIRFSQNKIVNFTSFIKQQNKNNKV